MAVPFSRFHGKIWGGFCLNTGKCSFLEVSFSRALEQRGMGSNATPLPPSGFSIAKVALFDFTNWGNFLPNECIHRVVAMLRCCSVEFILHCLFHDVIAIACFISLTIASISNMFLNNLLNSIITNVLNVLTFNSLRSRMPQHLKNRTRRVKASLVNSVPAKRCLKRNVISKITRKL